MRRDHLVALLLEHPPDVEVRAYDLDTTGSEPITGLLPVPKSAAILEPYVVVLTERDPPKRLRRARSVAPLTPSAPTTTNSASGGEKS